MTERKGEMNKILLFKSKERTRSIERAREERMSEILNQGFKDFKQANPDLNAHVVTKVRDTLLFVLTEAIQSDQENWGNKVLQPEREKELLIEAVKRGLAYDHQGMDQNLFDPIIQRIEKEYQGTLGKDSDEDPPIRNYFDQNTDSES